MYSEYLNRDARESFGDFIIGGQVIRTVKYTVDLVLLAKKEVLLQVMIERLIIEIGRCYVLEINVEKTKVMGMSRQPSSVQIMIWEISQRLWNISAIWLAW